MKRAGLGVLCAIAIAIAACASLPQSPDESIAYGYGVYTGVENALSVALENRSISKAQAVKVDADAGKARALLDAAHAVESTDPNASASDLAAATAALTALQSWLNAPTGDPP